MYVTDDPVRGGWTTIHGGDRFAYHGVFAPGDVNGVGFEDLVAIEDHEFCLALSGERPFHPGFDDAVRWASVQDALLRSAESGYWADVVDPTDRSVRAQRKGW